MDDYVMETGRELGGKIANPKTMSKGRFMSQEKRYIRWNWQKILSHMV